MCRRECVSGEHYHNKVTSEDIYVCISVWVYDIRIVSMVVYDGVDDCDYYVLVLIIRSHQ